MYICVYGVATEKLKCGGMNNLKLIKCGFGKNFLHYKMQLDLKFMVCFFLKFIWYFESKRIYRNKNYTFIFCGAN
jgi:hypothetical protein